MERDDYLRAIGQESARAADAARLGLDPPVPCCPGWTAGDLLQHLGEVYEFVTAVVENRAQDEEQDVAPLDKQEQLKRQERGAWFARSPDLPSWFEDTAGRLIRVLGNTDPDESVWTWWRPEQRAAFWQRRMAHESAVHRWDLQSAHGEPDPIGRELALDGVDEALTVHAPERRSECETEAAGETYLFEPTDGDTGWFVRLGRDRLEIRRGHHPADVVATGTASDLLLFLWQRLPVERLGVTGDAALLGRWFELVPPD